jgi:anti-sigma B factor antagonist
VTSNQLPAPRLGELVAVVRRHGDALVIQAAGEIDVVTAPQLAEAITSASGQPADTVVVDLTEVTFLGSAGLAVLVGAQEQVGDRRFRIVAGTTIVLRSLMVTGLTDVLAAFPTLDAALAARA